MINNDVLKKLRYILNFSDLEMVKVFKLGLLDTEETQIKSWLLHDESPDYQECSDRVLASFLNGLIIKKRGKKEGAVAVAESKLTNNITLRKLMIAYNLKSEDVIEVLKFADLRVGKSELSAFFRKSDHRNYRECKAQVLRNFLMGLQLKERSP